MIAARLSSALRDLPQRPLAKSGARVLTHALGGRTPPLAAAIDAERHEIATADAGTLSYYADTRAAGRPLVLLHGLHPAASCYELRPLFETFRARRPVYALDLPGFGFSERSARPYTAATYVHAIEHLLRNVAANDGADLLALSLSGEHAAKVAVEMPELVRSLVLISPTGFASPAALGPIERRARHAASEDVSKLALLPFARPLYRALVSKPSLGYLLHRSLEQRVDPSFLSYAYATSHQPGAWHAPIAQLAGALFPSGDPRQLYARVRAPTLVLYDQDPSTSFGELEAFVAAHPNFQARRISHTRGLPQFDAPEQTAEALRSFFGGLGQKARLGNGMSNVRFLGSA